MLGSLQPVYLEAGTAEGRRLAAGQLLQLYERLYAKLPVCLTSIDLLIRPYQRVKFVLNMLKF